MLLPAKNIFIAMMNKILTKGCSIKNKDVGFEWYHFGSYYVIRLFTSIFTGTLTGLQLNAMMDQVNCRITVLLCKIMQLSRFFLLQECIVFKCIFSVAGKRKTFLLLEFP